LLEHSGLGGNISRGYGQVKFIFAYPIIVKREEYETGANNFENASKSHSELKIDKTLADLHKCEIKL